MKFPRMVDGVSERAELAGLEGSCVALGIPEPYLSPAHAGEGIDPGGDIVVIEGGLEGVGADDPEGGGAVVEVASGASGGAPGVGG